jgi:hypothetical protein
MGQAGGLKCNGFPLVRSLTTRERGTTREKRTAKTIHPFVRSFWPCRLPLTGTAAASLMKKQGGSFSAAFTLGSGYKRTLFPPLSTTDGRRKKGWIDQRMDGRPNHHSYNKDLEISPKKNMNVFLLPFLWLFFLHVICIILAFSRRATSALFSPPPPPSSFERSQRNKKLPEGGGSGSSGGRGDGDKGKKILNLRQSKKSIVYSFWQFR